LDMETERISLEFETGAEALDAMEEIRSLFEVAEDGILDLGPALRSLLRNAYWAIDAALARSDVAGSR
jgi:hypothetical protein